jgi:hypothetical protein
MKLGYFLIGIIALLSIAVLSLCSTKIDGPYVGSCNGQTKLTISAGQQITIQCMDRDAEIICKEVK